jgi:hypothetical protein
MSVSKQKVIKFTAPAAHYSPLGINAQRVVAKRYSLKDIKGNPLERLALLFRTRLVWSTQASQRVSSLLASSCLCLIRLKGSWSTLNTAH